MISVMSMSCHLRKMAEWFVPILWSLGDASANSQDVHHDEINIAEILTKRRRQSSGSLVEAVTIVCGGSCADHRPSSRIATRWLMTFERPKVSPLRGAARTVVRTAAHLGAHSRPDEGLNQDLAAGAVAVAQTSLAQRAGSRREPRK